VPDATLFDAHSVLDATLFDAHPVPALLFVADNFCGSVLEEGAGVF
jgi:hypothetical protein